ncbi:MAG: hypothetical protein ABFR47_04235 [Verrucomicrobiota bacterium]
MKKKIPAAPAIVVLRSEIRVSFSGMGQLFSMVKFGVDGLLLLVAVQWALKGAAKQSRFRSFH